MLCKKCNKQVSILDNQCPHCGHDLTKVDLEKKYNDTSITYDSIESQDKWCGQGYFKEAGVKDIEVEVHHYDRLNWAVINFGIPLVRSLTISNISYSTVENIIIRIKLSPDFGEPWDHSIPVISPKESIILESIEVPLSKERLLSIKEAEQAALKTEVSSNGNILFLKTTPIEILAFNEWDSNQFISDSLAGFVLPNCDAVKETIKNAGTYLKELSEKTSFDGYQSRDEAKVVAMAHALYLSLQKKLKIKYISPPASFEKTGQKIRFPQDIVDIGRGTCLDLALFYAACLEAIGLFSVIFLVPRHALLGFWLSPESHADFWQKEAEQDEIFRRKFLKNTREDDERIKHLQERYGRYKEAIETSFILPLNSTTFTTDGDFNYCKEEGVTICSKTQFETVVDIAMARNRVKPMPI